MANISGFAIKGATATPARAVLVAEMAAQPTIHVPVVPAKGAAVPATTAVFVTRNPKVADVFMDPVWACRARSRPSRCLRSVALS